MATSECLPCEYDPTLDNRQRKTSPLATTVFAFVEAMDEPCHVTILLTPWMRLMRLHRVSSDRPVPTEWHRHTADSLYLFLADADIHTQTDAQAAPVLTHANAEAAFFAPHSRAPLVHQVCPVASATLFVLDVELLAPPPCAASAPLDHPNHRPLLVAPPSWTNAEAGAPSEDVPARVYRLDLDAHSDTVTTPAAYGFHGALVVAEPCEFEMLLDGQPVHVSAQQPAHAVLLEPCASVCYRTGDAPLRAYVIELTQR